MDDISWKIMAVWYKGYKCYYLHGITHESFRPESGSM